MLVIKRDNKYDVGANAKLRVGEALGRFSDRFYELSKSSRGLR